MSNHTAVDRIMDRDTWVRETRAYHQAAGLPPTPPELLAAEYDGMRLRARRSASQSLATHRAIQQAALAQPVSQPAPAAPPLPVHAGPGRSAMAHLPQLSEATQRVNVLATALQAQTTAPTRQQVREFEQAIAQMRGVVNATVSTNKLDTVRMRSISSQAQQQVTGWGKW